MQRAQTTGVSGLAPSQPHHKALLLSVQSHEMTTFPAALAGELCFKNQVTAKPLFISHRSSATLRVPKHQFNHCSSHVARTKTAKGCALQRPALKTQNGQLHRHYVTPRTIIKYILGLAGMSLSIKPTALKNRRPNSFDKKHTFD